MTISPSHKNVSRANRRGLLFLSFLNKMARNQKEKSIFAAKIYSSVIISSK
jgi:hypothetical protein